MGKKILRMIVLIWALVFAWYYVRPKLRPQLAITPKQTHMSKQVRIMRDHWGGAHVFGRTDRDTAFGFAYAHAEDNWPWIEKALAAARGKLSLLMLSQDAVMNDFFVGWLGIDDEIKQKFSSAIPDDLKSVLDGYAEGLNYYGALHPNEVDTRLLPLSAKDILAGFLHRIPLMEGLGEELKRIHESDDRPEKVPQKAPEKRSDGEYGATENHEKNYSFLDKFLLIGSNAHAVSYKRSKDGLTRLNVNSHQPWEGPVSWYEAHLVSEEGWNMTGGTFPGAPFILAGHNDYLGWAHTVNRPDLVDVFRLKVDDKGENYWLDNSWKAFIRRKARFYVDIGVLNIPVTREVLVSDFGPVIKTKHGFYAFRLAGHDRIITSALQWYRMNKARNFDEWLSAMRLHGIPMFNTVYADKKNIYYVYNALLPLRKKAVDWKSLLDGTSSELIWKDYLAYDDLPAVLNPPSGFVQNCNSTPYRTTIGENNPRPEKFASEFGIENRMSNRAVRSLELLANMRPIGMDDFVRIKFDSTYSKESPLYKNTILWLLENYAPKTPVEKKALGILRDWDGVVSENSTTATLGLLTLMPFASTVELKPAKTPPKPAESFIAAIEFLTKHYRRLDVPVGTVQRLRRGGVDLPLGGGPDLLHAVYGNRDSGGSGSHASGKLIGRTGDSFILMVEFGDETRSMAVHQYGNSEHPLSRHFDDQSRLFASRKLRKVLRKQSDIQAHLDREYHPGEEIAPRGQRAS